MPAHQSILNNIFGLTGEVAVVTGALGKLGSIWIYALASAGAKVFAIDKPNMPASSSYNDLERKFGKSQLVLAYADIKNRTSLETASNECIKKLGTPSVLVNNAGIDSPPSEHSKSYKLEDIPFEINKEIIEVNTLGLFQATQVFGSEMVKAKHGSIINIGSLYASVSPNVRLYDHIVPPFLKPPAYGASKAAVVNLTKYLATLWAPFGVRVNTLSPGGVLGGQDEKFKRKFYESVPLGRMAEAKDLWGPLLFLASQASSYITGFELIVDGGFTAW